MVFSYIYCQDLWVVVTYTSSSLLLDREMKSLILVLSLSLTWIHASYLWWSSKVFAECCGIIQWFRGRWIRDKAIDARFDGCLTCCFHIPPSCYMHIQIFISAFFPPCKWIHWSKLSFLHELESFFMIKQMSIKEVNNLSPLRSAPSTSAPSIQRQSSELLFITSSPIECNY